MEPYLGDVIGDLPPMKPLYRRRPDRPRWIENGVPVFIGALAVAVFFALIAIAVVISFLFASQPSLAAPSMEGNQPVTELQVRRDCTFDALRYCKSAIVTGDRMAVINCMLGNRDKLQAKCSRHLR